MPKFTKIVPPYLWLVSIGILATLPLFQTGYNIWAFGQPMLAEGREWVEAGRLWDILLFMGFFIFALAILKTLPSSKKWSIPVWALTIATILIMVLYVPGNIFFADLSLSEFFRWWTVHYWVEGVLEIAYVAIIGLVLIFMIPSPRVKGIVEKYVFYEVILVATAGIIGNGHHYFWIGTPTFWILLGGILGVLEIVPIILMILDSYKVASKLEIKNRLSFYYLSGFIILFLIGPALLGLTQTWPWTNWWEHGTWVTPAHGHLGMLAFGMGAISVIFFIIPDLANRPIDSIFEKYGKSSFWFLFIGMIMQAFIFGIAGTIQIFNYRVLNLGWQEIFFIRAQAGSFLAISGTLLFIGFMLFGGVVLRHLYIPSASGGMGHLGTAVARAFYGSATIIMRVLTSFQRFLPLIMLSLRGWIRLSSPSLSDFEELQQSEGKKGSFLSSLEGIPILILLALIFSIIVTTGLWSFSSATVLEPQDPTLPYTFALVGYSGLSISAVLLAVKLIRGAGRGVGAKF